MGKILCWQLLSEEQTHKNNVVRNLCDSSIKWPKFEITLTPCGDVWRDFLQVLLIFVSDTIGQWLD